MSKFYLLRLSMYEALSKIIAGYLLLLGMVTAYPIARMRLKLFPKLTPKSILLVGAGSGVGKALAEEYASAGIKLILLDTIEQAGAVRSCQERSAEVTQVIFDIDNPGRVYTSLKAIDLEQLIDLVIVCKAEDWYSHANPSTDNSDFSIENMGESLLTRNSHSLEQLIRPIVEGQVNRRKGKIMFVTSSSAQAFGISGSLEYAAAHARLTEYAQALREKVAPASVSVSVVCLGSVRTELADNSNLSSCLTHVSLAAKFCRNAIDGNFTVIAQPLVPHTLFTFAGNLFSLGRASLAQFLSRDFRGLRLP